MIWLETLLSIFAVRSNLSHTISMLVDSEVCPSNIISRIELCPDIGCDHAILLNSSDQHINSTLCHSTPKELGVCTTPDCVKTASWILKNLDETVNPCKDFFQFACGSFAKHNKLDKSENMKSPYTLLNDFIEQRVRNMLEKPIIEINTRPNVLAKTLYQACKEETTTQKRGHKPLQDLLKRVGGWPALLGHKWSEGGFSWEKTLYRFRKEGGPINIIFGFSLGTFSDHDDLQYIHLHQPVFLEKIEKLVDSNFTAGAYSATLAHIAKLLGAEANEVYRELTPAVKFEAQLAEIAVKYEHVEKREKITIEELSKLYSQFNWLQYINNMVGPLVTFDKKDTIIIENRQMIGDILTLVQKTPKRAMANFMMMRLVLDKLRYMSEVECDQIVIKNLPHAVAAMYIEEYYDEYSINKAMELFISIRERIYKMIQDNSWLDAQSLDVLLAKVKNASVHLGYPSELVRNGMISEYYKNLELSSDKFLESLLNCTIFNYDHMIARPWITFKDSHICEYNDDLLDTRAEYFFCHNAIEISIGMLQGVFFGSKRPAYVNYASLGNTIGHEIIHAFEAIEDSLPPQTRNKQEQLTECYIDQYNSYIVEPVTMPVNGKLTHHENIADHAGIKAAYAAYELFSKTHGVEQTLPGLERFTNKQIFWLTTANEFCEVIDEDYLIENLVEDEYAPNNYRVIGPLSNMREFARDFQCPIGSEMNPVKKCDIW